MINVKIHYLIMPWQIDYAQQSYIQFKKSKYYLTDNINITIDTHLNLSSFITDWNKTQIPKQYFIDKFKSLEPLLSDYNHNSIIYDGQDNYGLFDMQKTAIGDYDYYIPVCPDIYFTETLLYYLIESAKLVTNKYFVITPEVHKLWDASWDVLTNKRYINNNRETEQWINADVFDIRNNIKSLNEERKLDPIQTSKWAIWFDLYNKEFYENLCPVHDNWIGYGPWDWYSNMLSQSLKNQGVDFQQYALRGEVISEYQIGPLRDNGLEEHYKKYFSINAGAKEQRDAFEKNMNLHLECGMNMLKEKNII